MTGVLVLGGVRSGKSAYAESLLAERERVTYLAPGHAPSADDPDWQARVDAHRERRPASWVTVEGGDVPAAVATLQPGEAMLLDCLGTWVARLVDDADAWSGPSDVARRLIDAEAARLADALADCLGDVVVVSNEVGLGVVPAAASGRLFRDLLGHTNRVVADACEHVALVVAGRVLDLSGAPDLATAPTFGLRRDPPGRSARSAVSGSSAFGGRPANPEIGAISSDSMISRGSMSSDPAEYTDRDIAESTPAGHIDLWEDAGLTGFDLDDGKAPS